MTTDIVIGGPCKVCGGVSHPGPCMLPDQKISSLQGFVEAAKVPGTLVKAPEVKACRRLTRREIEMIYESNQQMLYETVNEVMEKFAEINGLKLL